MNLIDKIIRISPILWKIDDRLKRWKPIHLCSLFEKLGLPVPRYFVGWTDLGGGDHGGADWEPADGLEIAGNHTNIGAFNVLGGRTVNVKAYDGASYGTLEIHANTISVVGTLAASGKGFGGGGGGGGGHGECYEPYCTQPTGDGGSGVAGGSDGLGDHVTGERYDTDGFAGGAGGGDYGGAGGAGGLGSLGNCWDDGPPGSAGAIGGYAISEGQGDASIDESLKKGSAGGGAGGAAGGQRCAGDNGGGGGGGAGAGNRGSGWIKLYATTSINISGYIYAKGLDNSAGNGSVGGNGFYRYGGGAGGDGGSASASGGSNGGEGGLAFGTSSGDGGDGGEGGYGAGGGILLKCLADSAISITGTIDDRGGGNSVTNGGTVKIFYTGTKPAIIGISTGRLYIARRYIETYTEGITLSDTLKKKVAKTFSESISLGDTFSRTWHIYRTFSETLNLNDTVSKKVKKTFLEAITLVDTVKKKIAKTFTESISLTDTFSRIWRIYRTFSESITLADTVSKKVGKIFRETLHLTDTFSRIWTIYRIFTEKIALTDKVKAAKVNLVNLIKKLIQLMDIRRW